MLCALRLGKPRILIPYTGRRARIEIQVIDKNPAVHARDLSLYVEDRQVQSWMRIGPGGSFDLVADIPLHNADYTVLTLNAPTFRRKDIGLSADQRKLGLAVDRIALRPLEPRPRWWPQWRRRSSAFLKGILKIAGVGKYALSAAVVPPNGITTLNASISNSFSVAPAG
jgi:hypothetical protein